MLAGQLQTVPSSSAQITAAVMVSARTQRGYVYVKKDTVGSAAAQLLVFERALVMDRASTRLVSVTVRGPKRTARSSRLPPRCVQMGWQDWTDVVFAMVITHVWIALVFLMEQQGLMYATYAMAAILQANVGASVILHVHMCPTYIQHMHCFMW